MRLNFYIASKRPSRKHHILTDSPIEKDAVSVYMSPEEFIEYQQAKSKYENWQRVLAHKARYGW